MNMQLKSQLALKSVSLIIEKELIVKLFFFSLENCDHPTFPNR
jgi:hypothetical protein